MGSWLACHEFKPSTTIDPPCRAASLSRAQMSSRWCGSWERGVLAQVSSSSLDYGLKLRGLSSKALV
ncbi:hypothetical protein TNCV_782961 [Trichonephila clavipes]|nr:hypothetical protein TNCV_782961 [Trichonephila clavipes]